MSEQRVETEVIGYAEKPRDYDFLKVFPAFFYSFLELLQVADGRCRLVLYFMYKANQLPTNSDNIVFAPNEEMEKLIQVSRPTLLRHINHLIKIKFIKRLTPRAPNYKVNPEMIYKGNIQNYNQRFNSKANNGR